MNPLLNMEQHKGLFTQNDLIIYQAILENPEQVIYLSTNRLAEALGVSQPALSRFVKTLGYARYQDFRSDLTAWLAKEKQPAQSNRLPYFERLQQLLAEAEQVMTESMLKELAGMVRNADHVFATGIGKSFYPALLLQTLFRKHSIFPITCPLDQLYEYADQMAENDLMIAFSVSARGELMEKLSHTRGKVLLITTNARHGYGAFVDRTVVLPYLPPNPEGCPVSPVLFDLLVELLDQYLSADTEEGGV